MKKRLSKALFVEEKTHKRVFRRKIDRKMPDIDTLINHLLDSENEVNRRK